MFKRFFNFSKKDNSSKADSLQNQLPQELTSPQVQTINDTISITDAEINEFVANEIKTRIKGEELFDIADLDPLIKESASIIFQYQQASASLIQRKLKLGYMRAERIINQLEAIGLVGEFKGTTPRQVLMTSEIEFTSIFKTASMSSSKKRKYFNEHILPSKLVYIEQQVEEVRLKEHQKQLEAMKVKIREELLAKETLKRQQQDLQLLKSQVLKEMIESGEISDALSTLSREPISQDVKDIVWNRDGGKCVICGSNEKLEFDHIIPFSKGGSNTYRNIQLLCERCNREKSAKIG